MRYDGIKVLGTTADIKAVAERVGAHEIIVAIPSAPTQLKQKILAGSEGCTVPIKILPSVKRLLGDPVSLQQVRPMSLEDLLQREPIQTDRQELHPLIEGKTVLVTGAGGSIGSELCRQIAQYKPESLVLFEQYENSLHALLLELRSAFPHVGVLPVAAVQPLALILRGQVGLGLDRQADLGQSAAECPCHRAHAPLQW